MGVVQAVVEETEVVEVCVDVVVEVEPEIHGD